MTQKGWHEGGAVPALAAPVLAPTIPVTALILVAGPWFLARKDY